MWFELCNYTGSWSRTTYEKWRVTKTVSESDIDSFVRNLKVIALGQDAYSIRKAAVDFIHLHSISDGSRDTVLSVADGMLEAGKLKIALSDNWVVKQRNMGVVGFTLFFAFFSVIGINVVAFALALALDTGLHGQKILRTVFFLPNVLSMIIVALIWNMLFVQLLPALTGVEKWISDPNKTPWLLVVVAVWQGAGYYMIVYLAGLQNIPTEIIEAAKIDGANGLQIFTRVTWPMLKPTTIYVLIITLTNAYKMVDHLYIMTKGGPGNATNVLLFYIYQTGFDYWDTGKASAMTVILVAVLLVVTSICFFVQDKKAYYNN